MDEALPAATSTIDTERSAVDGAVGQGGGSICQDPQRQHGAEECDRPDPRAKAEAILTGCALLATCEVRELEDRHWSQKWRVRRKSQQEMQASCAAAWGTGTTCAVEPSSKQFLVHFDGEDEPVPVCCDDLLFEFEANEDAPMHAASSSSSTSASLQAVRECFIVGSFFEGTIAIPGMAKHSLPGDPLRQPYKLEVLSETVDGLGEPAVLICHSAYDDEQACCLRFEAGTSAETSQEEVRVSWADGETICDGIVEFHKADEHYQCVLKGRVTQLVQGEDGFFEPSREVTHTFELKRVTSCRAQAQHAKRLEECRNRRINELCAWIQDRRTLHDSTIQQLAGLPWNDIMLRDASRMCEVQCAKLRLQSTLLDNLRFETWEEKAAKLGQLAENGATRAKCHSQNDWILVLFKTLLIASSHALRDSAQLQTAWIKAHHRIAESYARFDHSLRSAEARLPLKTLCGWRVRSDPVNKNMPPCAVCFLPLDDSEDIVQLPCDHYFHFECVGRWLHSNTTCPNCRRDFKEAATGTETRSVSTASEMR